MKSLHKFHKSLDAIVCQEIIAKFEADPRKKPGQTMDGYRPDLKNCTDLSISELVGWEKQDREIYQTVKTTFQQYIEKCPGIKYLSNTHEIVDTGYQIQRYSPTTDYFNWHIDNGGPETCSRILAGIIYLNDVEQGGETEFASISSEGEEIIKVKPEEGLTIWFPPSFEYPHRGVPPISGNKYIITTFMVFKGN